MTQKRGSQARIAMEIPRFENTYVIASYNPPSKHCEAQHSWVRAGHAVRERVELAVPQKTSRCCPRRKRCGTLRVK